MYIYIALNTSIPIYIHAQIYFSICTYDYYTYLSISCFTFPIPTPAEQKANNPTNSTVHLGIAGLCRWVLVICSNSRFGYLFAQYNYTCQAPAAQLEFPACHHHCHPTVKLDISQPRTLNHIIIARTPDLSQHGQTSPHQGHPGKIYIYSQPT